MRYGWTGLGAACLLAVSAHAQETSLQKRYEHVQELNNESWTLLSAQPSDPQKLARAVETLKASLVESRELQTDIDGATSLDVVGCQWDAQFRLAKAYAQLGERQQALDALEALLKQDWVSASAGQQIAEEHAFDGLHDEPRYQSVLAALKRLDSQWNAPSIATASNELDEAHRIAGLSLFWSEARYNFVHFDKVPDLDWNQVYLDFLPKVVAAKNLHDYYDVMMRFAPLLHDGHTNIYPPKAMWDEFYAKPPIRTAMVDGHVLVTVVFSPKVAPQVHVGDEIVTIDGEDARQYAQTHVAPYISDSTPQDALQRTYDDQLLQGDHRKPVVLGLKDASGRMRTIELSREKDPAAKPAPPAEWRMLPGGVAYLALNEFGSDDGVKAFEHALPQILRAKGLILDLRRNGGGSDLMGARILSYLTDQPIAGNRSRSLEYVPVFRANDGAYVAWKSLGDGGSFQEKHEQRYHGPVVLLIGPRTYSAAEDFVVAFDTLKRGALLGEATGGSTGQPLHFTLPGGGMARICAKSDSYPDGREFVGKGIAPHVMVAPTVEDIRAGRDPVIQRALVVLAGKDSPKETPAP